MNLARRQGCDNRKNRLPAGIVSASAESLAGDETDDEAESVAHVGTAADGATIKEGSYLPGTADRLVQIVDGEPRVAGCTVPQPRSFRWHS